MWDYIGKSKVCIFCGQETPCVGLIEREPMTEYKVGDRVSITHEGVVKHLWGAHCVKTDGPEVDNYVAMDNGKVTVIEKAKPKVGDVFAGRTALRGLPIGSVVHGAHDGRYGMVIAEGGTRNHLGEFWSFEEMNPVSNAPYTLVYIP